MLFSDILVNVAGCQRSNFTTQARSTKCQHKGQGQLIHPAWLRVGLGAGAVPTCSIRTSVTNRLWKTGAWGRAKDPSVSAADVKASSVTETASESKELPPSPESKSPPSSSSAAGGVRDVNVSIVLGSSGSSEGKEGEAKAVLKGERSQCVGELFSLLSFLFLQTFSVHMSVFFPSFCLFLSLPVYLLFVCLFHLFESISYIPPSPPPPPPPRPPIALPFFYCHMC